MVIYVHKHDVCSNNKEQEAINVRELEECKGGLSKRTGEKKGGRKWYNSFSIKISVKKRYLLKTKYLHNKQMIPDSPRPAQLCTKIKVQRHSVGLTN